MQTLVFSSDQFPARSPDTTQVLFWRDITHSRFGGARLRRRAHRSERAHVEVAQVNRLVITRSRIAPCREPANGAASPASGIDHALRAAAQQPHYRGPALRDGGALAVYIGAEAEDGAGPEASWVGFVVARSLLGKHIAQTGGLVLLHGDGGKPVIRHLERYLNFLLDVGEIASELDTHIEATVLDLAALALTDDGVAAAPGGKRGLRSARLREVLGQIKTNFSDPAITVRGVAARLGVSPRYVNELLHETGASFSARVLELRLQKARAMLGRCSNDGLRISEIAYACGFNEVSYFNRCFRQRFGAPPTHYRSLH